MNQRWGREAVRAKVMTLQLAWHGVWKAQVKDSELHLKDHSNLLVGSEPKRGTCGSAAWSSSRHNLRPASTGSKQRVPVVTWQ